MSKNTFKGVDVEALLRGKYDSLSPGQQKVAEFLLTHSAEAVYLSAPRIAKLVGVSHSTVVRTAQRLGFSGFPELQSALQTRYVHLGSAVERFRLSSAALDRGGEAEATDADLPLLHRVMLTDIAHLQEVLERVPVHDFDRAAEMLDQARRVYIVGLRASASLAFNFGLALRYIRPECYILQPGVGDLPDQLMELSAEDLLVTMSYGRYTRDTIRCMDVARSVGAQVLTITDNPLSPAAKRADVALVVPIRVWFYVMSAAPHSLVSALLVAVAMRRKEQAQERLERIDRYFQLFGTFENEDQQDLLRRIEQHY